MSDLLTSKEAMAYLRVSRVTLYRLIKSGQLTGRKVLTTWRFRREDLDKCIKDAEVAASKPDSQIARAERRLEQAISALVASEQPESEEEAQALRDDWRSQGEDAVHEAMRYLRKKARNNHA